MRGGEYFGTVSCVVLEAEHIGKKWSPWERVTCQAVTGKVSWLQPTSFRAGLSGVRDETKRKHFRKRWGSTTRVEGRKDTDRGGRIASRGL